MYRWVVGEEESNERINPVGNWREGGGGQEDMRTSTSRTMSAFSSFIVSVNGPVEVIGPRSGLR